MAAVIKRIFLTIVALVFLSAPIAADTLFGKSPEVLAVPNGITDVGTIILRHDNDRDGIDDDWERLYGLDPTNPLDSFNDNDGDSLQNVQEYQAGTNPLNSDTDGDGSTDSEELAFGTNPLDPASKPTSSIVSIAIIPPSFQLIINPIIGQTSRQLKVLATMQDGTVIDITSSARGTLYSSDNSSVASVTAEGLVIATLAVSQQSGSTTITAINNGITATASIHVARFSPRPIAQLTGLLGPLSDLDASGNRLYVAARTGGVYIIDISLPASPVILTRIEGGDAYDVKVAGNLLYVANGNSDMRIIDRQTLAVSELPGTSGAVDLAVNSRYVFLACGSQGLKVVDRNTLQVFTPSDLSLQTGINNVDVNENHGIVQKGTNNLLVIDIQNANQIISLGSYGPFTEIINDVLISGSLAFIANDIDGIQILNIANPQQPVLLSAAQIPGQGIPGGMLSTDLALLGSFLFTADIFYVNAVPIFSIFNPAVPTVATVLDFSDLFQSANGIGIDADGEYVYVCTESTRKIEIGQYIKFNDTAGIVPSVRILSPTPGFNVLEGRPLTILVDATDDLSVESVEILINDQVVFTDSSYPYQHIYTVPLGDATSLNVGARAIDWGGNIAIAQNVSVDILQDAIPTVNITSPSNGSSVKEGTLLFVTAEATDDFEIAKVDFYVNNVLYLSDSSAPYLVNYSVPFGSAGSVINLQAKAIDNFNQVGISADVNVNVSDDLLPQVAIVSPLNNAVLDEDEVLNIAVTASDDISLSSVEIVLDGIVVKTFTTPQPLYEFAYLVPLGTNSITVTANAYDNRNQQATAGPVIVNVIDTPGGPTPVSEVALSGTASDIAITGNHGFIASETDGVLVVDISDPLSPLEISTIDTSGSAEDIKIQGNYAYVADNSSGLQILDISSPENVQIVGFINSNIATAVAISGTTAYVAGSSPSLCSVDVSNPASPILLDCIDLFGTAYQGIDVSGNTVAIGRPPAFLGQGSSIAMIDASDPSNLIVMHSMQRGSLDIATRNQYAFSVFPGLDVIDLSVPATPQLVRSITTTGLVAREVALSDELALLGISEGVALVDISDPTSATMSRILRFESSDYFISTGLVVQGDFVFRTATTFFGGPAKLFIGRYRAPEDNDGIPPSITITSPSAGSSVAEGSELAVSIDASDDIGVASVELLLDGAVVAADIVTPYQMNLTVPLGVTEITLAARATDFGGNVGTASDVLVTVTSSDTIPPNVAITSPLDGATADAGTNLLVTVDATDNVAVDFVELLVNGVIASTDSTAPYEFNITLPSQPGIAILTARASDTNGNSAVSGEARVSVCATTTIAGRTIDRLGSPAANMRIFVEGQQLAITNASGNFTISNTTVCSPTVQVISTGELAGQVVSGLSARLTVVVNGTTNSGDIVVSPLGVALYPGPEFPTGNAPNSAAVSDFDGDSIQDVVTANYGSESISLLLGNGQGLFLQEQRFDVGNFPASVAVSDFNGDGKTDVVTCNTGSNDVSVLIAATSGFFAGEHRYSVGPNPFSVAVGDFNNDGDADIVTANQGSDSVSILFGNGDGTFQSQQVVAVGDVPSSVAIGDLNGDNDLDIVTANRGCRFGQPLPCGNSNDISILFGNGDGTFQTVQTLTVGEGPFSVALGDLNEDGSLDIVTANEVADDISVLISSGGSFATQQRYPTGTGPDFVAIADLNNDAHNDVISSNAGSNDISVLTGDGNGVLATQQRFPTGPDPASVTVAELNSDSLQDVVVTNFDTANILILFGGTSILETQRRVFTGLQPNSVCASDLNEDGNVDLTFGHFGVGEIAIHTGNGDGSFTELTVFDVGNDGTVATVITEDLNSDSHVDLAWGDLATGELVVRFGNGDGTFGIEARYSANSGPFDVGAADFNGDSFLDIVTGNFFISNNVSVLLNNGDGSFQSPTLYGTGDSPSTVVFGNVNNDSAIDIITTNLDSNDVSILINNGDGTFQSEQRISVGTTPAEVVVADFDGDGKRDLATTNIGSIDISIRLGNGDGTFGALRNFETGDTPGSLRSADLNGDTFIDLIAGTENHSFILFLAGNGDGTFAPAQRYATGDTPASVAISDLNSDSKLDLVTTNFFSDDISILLNR